MFFFPINHFDAKPLSPFIFDLIRSQKIVWNINMSLKVYVCQRITPF
jgi:hypothetical protein